MRYSAWSSRRRSVTASTVARRRQVEHHRPDLGPQEVVRARRPERGQPRVLGAGQEVEHGRVVVEVPDLRAVGRGEARARSAAGRPRGPGAPPPAAPRSPAIGGPNGSGRPCSAMNRSAVPMISSEFASHASDVSPHAVIPWPPRMQPIASGWSRRIAAMSRPSWNPGRRQPHPGHAVPERLAGQRLAVGRRRQRDPGVRVEVVDVGGVDEAVHRGVDRRRRAAAAVQAVVERRDHLVLALDARIDVDQRAQPVEPEHRQPGVGQRAEVAAGALDPQQLDGRPGHRVDRRPLGRRVAARVVRVPRVRAEPVRPVEQRLARGRGVDAHAPHPAWLPPTRSSTIRSA